MNFNEKRSLGKTGLRVGRLGISSSFGAPDRAYDEALERGCNYFNWYHMSAASGRKAASLIIEETGHRVFSVQVSG